MGQQKQRLLKFLQSHPVCCFCGGGTPATTRDHLPPRGVFTNRKWPDGYEFPACTSCNADSAAQDSIFSMVSRINAGRDHTREESEEWKRQLRAFNERHPGEARKLLLTANEKREMLRTYNISKPDGMAHGELPIIRFTPLIHEAVLRVSRKLVCALHYKHTNRVIPSDAWLKVAWRTNVHRIANRFPEGLFDIFKSKVDLKRDSKSLGDQFNYQYAISDDGTLGGYIASFRRIFFVIGLVAFDTAMIDGSEEAQLEKALTAITSDGETSSTITPSARAQNS